MDIDMLLALASGGLLSTTIGTFGVLIRQAISGRRNREANLSDEDNEIAENEAELEAIEERERVLRRRIKASRSRRSAKSS